MITERMHIRQNARFLNLYVCLSDLTDNNETFVMDINWIIQDRFSISVAYF